jgi:hypothetical protein
MSEGMTMNNHREAPPSYLPDADPGRFGGGTLTAHSVEPTLEAYENIFGPSARDIKQDLQRFKRHGRWHLPDILKGPNQYLTDRVDGLITDATTSPFTSRILPYKYITNVDGKIKWNVWSFDEGLASRVPYESAARTLTQSKRSFAGYFIRQGMAIVLEHNFMMTEAGRENFRRQLQQLVGSIQLTNDLDVHVALILAPSYQKTMNEKYLTQDKSSAQVCREFVEMFGFVQKNQNALDILIEEAKGMLRTWGAPMPDFMLCNSKLTFQLTMTPDQTNYLTKGPEGAKKLKTGPEMSSYRGIGIVHTRAFSMETGAPPRDMLRRRVRVAEYYRIPPHKDNHKRLFQLYNEERDTWSGFTFQDLLQKALCDSGSAKMNNGPGRNNYGAIANVVTSMSMGSHPEVPHAAPRLGEVMPASHGNATLTGALTKCFEQLFLGKTEKNFSWEPMQFSQDIVFVPGAMDVTDWALTSGNALDDAGVSALPEYIKMGLRALIDSKRGPWPDTEKNEARILSQSMAPYHRNNLASAFQAKLARWETHTDKPGNFETDDAATMATGGGGACDYATIRGIGNAKKLATLNLYLSLMQRNYLRFGVPTALLRPTVAWGSPNPTLVTALNNAVDLTTMNYMDQRLRNKGAWFCPNHFKEPSLKLRTFGDYVGYHMLITKEFVQHCVMAKDVPTDPLFHTGTYLWDIIMQPLKHNDLYQDVKTILTNSKSAMDTGAATHYMRSKLYDDIGAQIKAAMDARKGNFGNKTFGPVPVIDARPYWYFPRTEKVNDEVFSSSRSVGWKTHLWNLANFQTELTISDGISNAISTDAGFDRVSPESVGYNVPYIPADFNYAAGADDARNFFCMIAWRLWADQEIPLGQVYNINAMQWPQAPDAYLFPVQAYNYAHYGNGIMTYGSPDMVLPPGVSARDAKISQDTEHIEVVIVRPNIEHYMMGIILGQGGESLGSTFWGQTELSCYDDSMHGIWGMSYKYHERAIVINERNLVRLWDIAYDGYVGGKDDTSVEWNNDSEDTKMYPHSKTAFIQATTDVTRPYRGPSMMVMAFHHQEGKSQASDGSPDSVFKRNYKANWPSPIVFYDRLDKGGDTHARADFDNLHVVEAEQFRVFNSPLYENAYRPYRDKMPNFWELHTIRKNAGLAATENEVSSDALAFQGTMRVLSADTGAVIQETLGSGHHGPDFIGVASLRAGKGYRLNSQPTVHRLV